MSFFTFLDSTDLDTYQKTKAEEILLCCKIRILGFDKCCLDEFEDFVERSVKLDTVDVFPSQLIDAVLETSTKDNDILEKKRAATLAQELINGIEQSTVFCSEMESLERILKSC